MGNYWNYMIPELYVSNFEASLCFFVDLLGFSMRIRRKITILFIMSKKVFRLC